MLDYCNAFIIYRYYRASGEIRKEAGGGGGGCLCIDGPEGLGEEEGWCIMPRYQRDNQKFVIVETGL